MSSSFHNYDFLLLNVPLIRPAWPVPAFSRILPRLKSEGFVGDWWDENVKFFRFYYSEEKLIWAYQVVKERLSCTDNVDTAKHLIKILEKPIDLIVESIKQISREEIFCDLKRYREVFYNVFYVASQLLSYAYDIIFDCNQLIYRSPINLKGYNFHKANDVIKLVNGDSKNISYNFFKEITLPEILQVMPRVIGISISSAFELVPAFTLAKLIKEEVGNKVHLVMGGNFLSRIEHRFRNTEREKEKYIEFWNWMDSYVISKGDLALAKLIKAVLCKEGLDSVPNLVYKLPDTIRETTFQYGPGINELPHTDYGSILDNKHLYFVPPKFLTIPIYASIGCSYAKCTFCAIDKMSGNYHANLRVKNKNGVKVLVGNEEEFDFYRKPEKVYDEIVALKKKHNINFFSFNDETADIDFLLDFCDEVIKNKEEIYWQAFVRLENKLAKPEVCEKLYFGGCRLVRVGFEYFSQEKLNAVKKGYSLKKQYDIVKNLNSAGIWVHAYFMLSGEDDFQQIMSFINNNDYFALLHSLEFFSFVKDRHSLDILEGLKSGKYKHEDVDSQFPEFRIWCDENIKARELVVEIDQFSRKNFPVYSLVCEPCEVAYFAPLNYIHGLTKIIEESKKIMRGECINDK
ncbi:MAG: hypothetical protein K6T66_04785 [Peptococcaceae bacterium]|nr:hypothetical protein [Peptococcaceae bacterium]